jgi:hypothetical protein
VNRLLWLLSLNDLSFSNLSKRSVRIRARSVSIAFLSSCSWLYSRTTAPQSLLSSNSSVRLALLRNVCRDDHARFQGRRGEEGRPGPLWRHGHRRLEEWLWRTSKTLTSSSSSDESVSSQLKTSANLSSVCSNLDGILRIPTTPHPRCSRIYTFSSFQIFSTEPLNKQRCCCSLYDSSRL